jgi:hypothetical protein
LTVEFNANFLIFRSGATAGASDPAAATPKHLEAHIVRRYQEEKVLGEAGTNDQHHLSNGLIPTLVKILLFACGIHRVLCTEY